MNAGAGLQQGVKLLVVTRDADLAAGLASTLAGFEVMALTEATTRHALGSDSGILDRVGVALLDGSVSGSLRLRLYDRLRPTGGADCTPVIFARSGFEAARHETARGSDLYLPGGSSLTEMAWWCRSLASVPAPSRGGGAESAVPSAALVPLASSSRGDDASSLDDGVSPVAHAQAARHGWVAQAGLWGVVAALSLVTIWPDAGRLVFNDAVRGQLRSLLGATSAFADAATVQEGPIRLGPR